MSETRPKRQLFDSRLKEHRDFWVKKLSREIGFSGLRPDHNRPDNFLKVTERVALTLGAELRRKLHKLTDDSPILTYATLMAALKSCLYRYTGSTSIVVGSPSSRREDANGAVANLLPIVDDVAGHESFRELLLKVRENLEQSYAHEDYPYERLLEDLGHKKLENRCELFDVALVVKSFHADIPETKNDLTLMFMHDGGELSGELEYNSSLFDRGSIERFAEHLLILLEAALDDLNTTISDLPLMSSVELRRQLYDWNDTRSPYPSHACIHELFAQQAARTPDAPALLSATDTLTYAELDARSNQLAHHLRRLGVGPEVTVGVCLERSVEMVVALLAILKAGGAYVPLDPQYPASRLALMLEDAGARLVITRGGLEGSLPREAGVRLLDIEQERGAIEGESEEDLSVEVEAENLAYVMYTSGSTGRPKGVAITHRNVVRLVRDTDYVHLTPSDRVAHVSNPAFDASTFEIWGALLSGARLVVIPRDAALSPNDLASQLERGGVTALFLTTALFNQVARTRPEAFSQLNYLLFGGEAVDPQSVREVLERGGPRHLLHVYGPTEGTTFSTWELVREVGAGALTVPIGVPIANTQAYILDGWMRAVAVGVAGELYVGGDGLMRGYVGEAGLTAERMIPHPFPAVSGERLYRTGDMARYLGDGRIEFVGRADTQVKVRGFRIELGEIESVLSQHPSLSEAVVITRAHVDGDKSLIAYVVKDQEATDEELQNFLAQKLPFYMVPSQFVGLEKLPLTANGKVDRNALPAPDKMRPTLDEVFVAPRNPTEKLVAEIWQAVLDIDRVGVNDNFFRLGGHSLLAIKVATRIREACQLEISLGRIFEAPTVAEVALIIDEMQSRPRTIDDVEIERMPRLDEDIAQVLAQLANLPEQEAQSLLSKETHAADNLNSNE